MVHKLKNAVEIANDSIRYNEDIESILFARKELWSKAMRIDLIMSESSQLRIDSLLNADEIAQINDANKIHIQIRDGMRGAVDILGAKMKVLISQKNEAKSQDIS
jgi:hypothetical protein